MRRTIVKCSHPGCQGEAVSKVAAPWKDGAHAELKTFGYTCAAHFKPMIDYAAGRPKSRHMAPDESVGDISTFPLAVL